MKTDIQKLLQVSASLYAQLGELPNSESRDAYIEEITENIETSMDIINQNNME